MGVSGVGAGDSRGGGAGQFAAGAPITGTGEALAAFVVERSRRRRPMIRAAALAPLALALSVGLAGAQGNTGPAGNPGHDARGQTPPEFVAPAPNRPNSDTGSQLPPAEATQALRTVEQSQQQAGMGGVQIRAGELDVVAADGRKIGEVEDVVIDGEGQLVGFVVETGGVLGLGERRHVVPRAAVRIVPGEDRRMRMRIEQDLAGFPRLEATENAGGQAGPARR
jgi:hypothetical protein